MKNITHNFAIVQRLPCITVFFTSFNQYFGVFLLLHAYALSVGLAWKYSVA